MFPENDGVHWFYGTYAHTAYSTGKSPKGGTGFLMRESKRRRARKRRGK